METETRSDERRSGVRLVRIAPRARGVRVTLKSVKRWFDTETAFATPAFGGGLFGGGKGKGTEGD